MDGLPVRFRALWMEQAGPYGEPVRVRESRDSPSPRGLVTVLDDARSG
ncbi:hypothetical protein AB0J63_31020 [Streptosporangium canum]